MAAWRLRFVVFWRHSTR